MVSTVLQQSVVTRSLLGGLAMAVPLSIVVGAVLQLAWAPELSMAASFPYAVLGGLMAAAVGGALGGVAGALWGWLIATIVDAVVSTVVQDKLEPWLSLGAGLLAAAAVGWVAGLAARAWYDGVT